MAQRAIIGINGELAPFDASLDKIRTPGIGASSVTWVPDADTRCTTLRVTANGTYNAAQRGDYGYDYVTVSVPGTSVTGRDPDTGEEVQVGVDPETGDIVETVLATEIRITTPPTKTSYVDGESIITDGMVVKAYDALGVEMLTVPIGEITINPTTAIFNEREYAIWVSSDFNIMPNPFQMGSLDSVNAWSVGGGAYRRSEYHVSMSGALKRLGSTGDQIIASDSPFSATVMMLIYYISKEEAEGHTIEELARSNLGTLIDDNVYTVEDNNSYTYGGRKVYYYAGGVGLSGYYDIEPIQAGNTGQIAWAMVYGDKTEGAPQTITVAWPRPGDGAVLETSFDIQVTPAGGDTP